MTHLSPNPIRQIIAAMLAVSLSVCCCQAHFLLHGFSDGEASDTAGSLETVSACCEGCADEDSESPGDDDSDAPLKSCKTCCIKGSGLKDLGAAAPDADVAIAPMFVLPAIVVHGEQRCSELRPTVDLARRRVDPRTLVRLHCALLV